MKLVAAPTLSLKNSQYANGKHFKCLGVWISYNKFSIGEKENKHKIACV